MGGVFIPLIGLVGHPVVGFLMVHPVMQSMAYPMAQITSAGSLVGHDIISRWASLRGIAHGIAHGIPHGSLRGEHCAYSGEILRHTP